VAALEASATGTFKQQAALRLFWGERRAFLPCLKSGQKTQTGEGNRGIEKIS